MGLLHAFIAVVTFLWGEGDLHEVPVEIIRCDRRLAHHFPGLVVVGEMVRERFCRVADGLRRGPVPCKARDDSIPTARSRSACKDEISLSRAASCRRNRWFSVSQSAMSSPLFQSCPTSPGVPGLLNRRQINRAIAASAVAPPIARHHDSITSIASHPTTRLRAVHGSPPTSARLDLAPSVDVCPLF